MQFISGSNPESSPSNTYLHSEDFQFLSCKLQVETQGLQGSSCLLGMHIACPVPASPDPRIAQSLLNSRPPSHSLPRALPPRPPGVLCSITPQTPSGPSWSLTTPAISPSSRACPCRSCRRPRALSTVSSSRNLSHLLQGLPSPLLRCPSQRLLDRVVRRYAEVADAGSIFMDHFTDRDKLRLLYTLAVNAHPILLQVCRDPRPRKARPGSGFTSSSKGAGPGLSCLCHHCTPWGHQPTLVPLWHLVNMCWLRQWGSAVVATEERGVGAGVEGWRGMATFTARGSPEGLCGGGRL